MTTPIISVICGTYKRLDTLKRMVNSVRETVPHSMPIEFVIADNDSQDGTWAWLQSQDDVTALQMGAPVGGVKAFTEAGKQARGKYTLIATDDIYFPPRAILRALTYLDKTPSCGAVTFKHNKNRDEFHAAYIQVTYPDGRRQLKPYTQISLVRTDLGNRFGWWGGDDAIMSQAFTYAGDNFLSAGIWEAGYTVDTVQGAHNIEDVFPDEGRTLNENRHAIDSALYFERYPEIKAPYELVQDDHETLRILLMLHYSPTHKHHKANKRWMKAGLQQLGIVFDYDYAGAHYHGADIDEHLKHICADFDPHLIITQVHQPANGFTDKTARILRTHSRNAVLINWNGDVWRKNIEHNGTLSMLRHYDLCLFSNAELSRSLAKRGYNTGFFPEGFEPKDVGLDTSAPTHDVLFTGNGYSDWRVELATHLKRLPYDVGIYGRIKGVETNGETMWDWSYTRGLYNHARVIISDQQFDSARGYVSKRLWEILAAGGLALQQHSAELDKLTGLQEGVHYRSWRTLDELSMLIDYYIGHPDERDKIAKAGHDYVWSQHNPTQRALQLIEYVRLLNGNT